MAVSPKHHVAPVLFVFLAMFLSLSCKPETPPAAAPQTGALVSPLPTATAFISPLSAPTLRSEPIPTPWPLGFTPSPQPTPSPTPAGIPYIITDPINQFTMTVLPGWYAYTPDAKAIAGVTSISNYDRHLIDEPPPGSLSIQIGAGPLPPSQSFAQWLSDMRARETSPEYGAFGVTLTAPQPYKLGRYEGVAYVATGQDGESVLVLLIPSGDRWVAVISLSPYDASNPPPPALSEALSMLSTIQISSISTPLSAATGAPTPPPWAITPEPAATATPPADKLTFYEQENHYSLKLLPGWYAHSGNGGEDSITNYDEETITDLNKFRPGDLKINIGVGRLNTGQSLQQWISNRITVNTSPSPDSPMPPATVTEPRPYTLEHYEGVAFFVTGQVRVMEIIMPWENNGVMVIDLMPADSSALSEALSMLSTINILP